MGRSYKTKTVWVPLTSTLTKQMTGTLGWQSMQIGDVILETDFLS